MNPNPVCPGKRSTAREAALLGRQMEVVDVLGEALDVVDDFADIAAKGSGKR